MTSMSERVLLLDSHSPPIRNGSGSYEFKADCGLQHFIVETDARITFGLNESQAQIRLRELRHKIQLAAQARRDEGDANPESSQPGELLFRIRLSAEDLA